MPCVIGTRGQHADEWALQRFVFTRSGQSLGIFSQSVGSGGAATAAAGASGATSLSALTQREKMDPDALPGDRLWSGVLVERDGHCYVLWDAGHLVRGLVGLQLSAMRHRVELVVGARAALRELLTNCGLCVPSGTADPSIGAAVKVSSHAAIENHTFNHAGLEWTLDGGVGV